jgi:cytochrome c oxidase subunit 2
MMSRVEAVRVRSARERGPAAPIVSRLRSLAVRAVPGLLTLALAACGGVETFPQTTFAPKSDYAIQIDHLEMLTIYLGVGVGVAIFCILAFILLRFRHRPGAPEPKHVHGNATLEVAWTLIPAVLLAIIAVPTVRTIFATQAPPPPNALEIDVRGYQWWWRFGYPQPNGDTVFTANEIHVPVGRPVVLKLSSADVIHSFWIPQMGGKRDVVPGRTNEIVFTPLEEGVYLGQCAEFCGSSHALMKMRLVAHKPADFQKWLAHQAQPAAEPTDSAVMVGKKLVTAGACAGCHTIDGTSASFGKTAPNLTHVASRTTIAAGVLANNARDLTAWIHDPQSVKPDARMPNLGLKPDEIRYIVAYLQTLY